MTVFLWEHIAFSEGGEVPDDFERSPDWTIEILSPEQKPNKVIGNILHCLSHGCQLGWFIDPDDSSILVFLPGQQPQLLQGSERLPVLDAIELELAASHTKLNNVCDTYNLGRGLALPNPYLICRILYSNWYQIFSWLKMGR